VSHICVFALFRFQILKQSLAPCDAERFQTALKEGKDLSR